MKMVKFENDGNIQVDLYGDDEKIQLSKYVGWDDGGLEKEEIEELLGLGRNDDLDDMEEDEIEEEWNKLEIMDVFDMGDNKIEVVKGNPDMLIGELLGDSDTCIQVNIEGDKVEDMELGKFFRLFLSNDLHMMDPGY